MNTIGMLSSSSAYLANANSVYTSTKTTLVNDKQESSDAQNSSDSTSFTGEINDEATISDEAMALYSEDKNTSSDNVSSGTESNTSEETDSKDTLSKTEKLTPDEEQEVSKLKARDAEVKAHEQAHIAAATGINASAPTFTYQTGPDGEKYAVGGEVNISFTEGKDPEENIANAEAMQNAALAPAQPSSQDLAVAKEAAKIIQENKQKLAEQKSEESQKTETDDQSSETEKTYAETTTNENIEQDKQINQELSPA